MNFFKKAMFLWGVVMSFVAVTQAQNIHYTLLKSNSNEAVVRVDFDNYHTKTVIVDGKDMQTLHMPNAYPILTAGNPELLQTAFSLIVPEGSQPVAEVIDARFTEIYGFELAPSKGNLFRNIDPADVPYQKNESYSVDQYLLGSPAQAEKTYQLRDYHGATIKVYPFDYNPVQQILKAYSSITVKVTFNGDRAVATATKNNRIFNNIYANQFLNYNSLRSNPVTEEGDILIIAPDEFMEAMQPYANWKIKCGYHTEIVPLSIAGNNANSIKTFILDYYNEHNLAFVVIVGDAAQFPTPTISGEKSDNYFTELVGDDSYPDIILGKISAENVEQVETQVQRFIEYEREPLEKPHYTSFLGIASNQGPGDNDEYDYQHIRNIDNKLLDYTYTSGYELFEGSQGGLDAAGNPSAAMVSSCVNSGVSIITYCGHGSKNSWVTSGFKVSNVNTLTNNDMLPFILSVACINGEYHTGTCFAEAWLRATNDGKPSGAVCFTGSTVNQSWNPPMCAQDATIDYIIGTPGWDQKFTFGGAFFNGMIKMIDVYSSDGIAMFRTWIIFGDPTLMIRTAEPFALDLEYNEHLPEGTMDVTFSAINENTIVCITKNNEIVATGRIQDGELTLPFNETFSFTDTLFVTATAPNSVPFEGIITFFQNDIPYVVVNNITLQEKNIPGRQYHPDGLAESGETLSLIPSIVNIGNITADNIHITITTNDEYITLQGNEIVVNTLNAHDTAYDDSFSFSVSENAPVNHIVTFNFIVTFDGYETRKSKSFKLYAPILKIVSLNIDDSESGNGNHKVDYGETFTCKITLTNLGNIRTNLGLLQITNPADELSLHTHHILVPTIEPKEQVTISLEATVHDTILEPTLTYLKGIYSVDHYSDTNYLSIKIGTLAEDWETGDFINMEWINNSSNPWTISTQNPYEGAYCVKSGSIGNGSSTILKILAYASISDSISFYYKVSSAEGDKLIFKIDGSTKREWEGVTGWNRASFPVTMGNHTYSWTFSKNYWGSSDRDCAFLDYISFPSGRINSELSVEDLTQNTPVLTIWPNPTSDYVHVQLSDDSQEYTYQLFNLSGQLLQGGRLDNPAEIDVKHLVSGIYLLKVENNQHQSKTTKIIKK